MKCTEYQTTIGLHISNNNFLLYMEGNTTSIQQFKRPFKSLIKIVSKPFDNEYQHSMNITCTNITHIIQNGIDHAHCSRYVCCNAETEIKVSYPKFKDFRNCNSSAIEVEDIFRYVLPIDNDYFKALLHDRIQ